MLPAKRLRRGYQSSSQTLNIRGICLMVVAGIVLIGCPPRQRRAGPCPSDQKRVCLSRCVTPSAINGPCTPGRNECEADYRPCQQGLACERQAANPTVGVCKQLPSLFCNPSVPPGSPENLCNDGFFCARYGTSAQVATQLACLITPNLNLPANQLRGICSRGRVEGESCDGDWSQTLLPLGSGQRPVCSACAPGLVCWNRQCRRPCRTDAGGLRNCVPDEETELFSTHWDCVPRTGRLTPSETSVTAPLCQVCVPGRAPCRLPPELLAQSRTRNPTDVCCDPGAVCRLPLDLTGETLAIDAFPTCCQPPAYDRIDGGVCRDDNDCCPLIQIEPFGVVIRKCCSSPNEPGCRRSPSDPPNSYTRRCAGCGPGTRVPCCDPSGLGCSEGQTCVGSGDQARCLLCGTRNLPCCRRGNVRTCNDDTLGCFDRPGEEPSGDRCLPCGEEAGRCCPGRRCSAEHLRCEGEGEGQCRAFCGLPGLPCCGLGRTTFLASCVGRLNCNSDGRCGTACGGNGQPGCNFGEPCDPGFGRDPQTGLCGCGRYLQPCCAREPRCVDDGQGNACERGTCRRHIG